MTLRFFVDSADPKNWECFLRRGWAFGATTNPVILRREGRAIDGNTCRSLAADAQNLGLKEVHIQATGATAEELFASGSFIAELGDHVRVKMPLVPAGLEAANRLAADNVPLTLTAAYAAHQMVAALVLGAAYIAPYYGRLIEAEIDGDAMLSRMRTIRDHNDGTTRILIAALRSVEQVENLLAQGHDTFTLSPVVAGSLAADRMSEAAFAEFVNVDSAA